MHQQPKGANYEFSRQKEIRMSITLEGEDEYPLCLVSLKLFVLGFLLSPLTSDLNAHPIIYLPNS